MWFKIENKQVALRIYAKPNAKRTSLVKIENNELHIALHAKPQEGEANKELISFIADLLDVPKSVVSLKRGQTSKHKEIVVPLTEEVQRFLDEHQNPPASITID